MLGSVWRELKVDPLSILVDQMKLQQIRSRQMCDDHIRQAEEDIHGRPCAYCGRMSGSRLKRLYKKSCEGCGAPGGT